MVFVFLFLVVLVAAGAGATYYIAKRRKERDYKNFERGLKMVSLIIHLPPLSDDTDGNGRDARDLVDENISKAQVIYNIIASTVEKGNKRHIYGQRHFGFEIIANKGFVHFYAVVPISLVEVVKQAVVSAYPAAQLEEVPEHNIFNQAGGINAVVGGELVLKEPFAYPIATYQEIKRDTIQSLLNSLSTIEKEDGVAIQLLMRPADASWRKSATTLSGKKRKGEDKSSSFGDYAKQMIFALNKPPEAKESKSNDLSGLDQSIVDAIDEKTRHAGYEVLIRVVASSNVYQRSQAVLSNVVATFSLFDAPGKNGFKYEPTKDVRELVTSYVMRFFPQTQNKNILNSVELATLFHFPDQKNIPTSQLERQGSKQVDGPRNVPDEGMLLGYNVFRGAKKPIRLAIGDRQRHMYIVGQTGTGKSTALENLALQDMIDGKGFAFIDPHGDTAEKLLSMVPRERTEDVIYFSPSDMDFPMGLNLFEFENEDQKDFLIQEALNMLQKLYDPQHQGIMGPRYEHLFRNAALTIMAGPDGGTFIDLPKLFNDEAYLKQKLQYMTNPSVLEFWNKEMAQAKKSNEFGDVVSWFVSKFGAFRNNTMMANIIGQTTSAFNLRDIMDNKKILLVNLSKGRMGDLNSKLLGMIFVMKTQAAAMSRANIPEDEREDFALYVDEFQNFSTDSFATILSEARKYHLNLIVANQFTTQLTEEIRDAVFGNIGTIIAYRIGQNDVEALGRYFQPAFDGDDLLRIPNYNSIVRTLIKGVPTQPFSMAALPPLGVPNEKLGGALKQLTAAKYGRLRKEVEDEITARLTTDEPALAPSFGAAGPSARPASFAPPASQPLAPSPQDASNGSFLDQWLQKRKALPAATAAPSFAPSKNMPQPPQTVSNARPSGDMAIDKPTVVAGGNRAQLPALDTASKLEPLPQLKKIDATIGNNTVNKGVDLSPDSNKQVSNEGSVSFQPRDQNISSNELERQEINQIAEELKQQLHTKQAVHDNNPPDQKDVTINDTDSDVLPPSTPMKPQDEDDTIYIDPEGTLHIKQLEPDEKADTSEPSA